MTVPTFKTILIGMFLLLLLLVEDVDSSSCQDYSSDEEEENNNHPFCNICGYRHMLPESQYNEEVYIPTKGEFTCQFLDQRSRQGYVPRSCCFALQAFTINACGCIPKPPPASPPVNEDGSFTEDGEEEEEEANDDSIFDSEVILDGSLSLDGDDGENQDGSFTEDGESIEDDGEIDSDGTDGESIEDDGEIQYPFRRPRNGGIGDDGDRHLRGSSK